MFTFLQLFAACVICFVVGVLFHAAIITWVDRIRDLAEAKIKDKLNLPNG